MAEDKKFYMLNNVRCSFPHLFEPPVINGDEGKCGSTLLLDEVDDADMIKRLQADITALAKAKFKKDLSDDKKCLRLGEDKRDEYVGYYALSANSQKRPRVFCHSRMSEDGRKPYLIENEDDGCAIYAGCRVNAKIQLWVQDNKYGKRVNAELVAIQFAGDDEAFDGSYVSPDDAAEGFAAAVGDDFMD